MCVDYIRWCFLTGSRSLLNLSTPEVPTSIQPVTTGECHWVCSLRALDVYMWGVGVLGVGVLTVCPPPPDNGLASLWVPCAPLPVMSAPHALNPDISWTGVHSPLPCELL